MSTDNTYSGWANYPTWNVKLWIDNDQGSYEYWREQARECFTGADGDEDDAISSLQARLEGEFDDAAIQQAQTGMFADLMTWALGMVDWCEIAASMIGDIDDDERAELCPPDESDDDDTTATV